MKLIPPLLFVVSLLSIDAYGVCTPTCTGNSLNVITNCCAVCDGTTHSQTTYPPPCAQATDDTCSINQALTAVNAAGGGEVIIPPGTCIISPTGMGLPLGSNLTIRGAGRKSALQVRDIIGSYSAIFGATTQVSKVVFKDFRIDQNPVGNPVQPGNEMLHVINLPVAGAAVGVKGITVSGMFFDAVNGVHAIHAENNGDLQATITNNYFNFQRSSNTSAYNNAAIYLEGSQQVVTNNTFFGSSPSGGTGNGVDSLANSAVETHGGRSMISNNTTNNYATLVDVVPTPTSMTELKPNNIVVANNSVTCAQVGISLWPMMFASTPAPDGTIRNVAVTGNTVHVCNKTRRTASNGYLDSKVFAGIRIAYDPPNVRNVDGLVISDNIISMESESAAPGYALAESEAISTGGIVLPATGTLTNVVVSGNIVSTSPMSGIRIGVLPSSGAISTAKQVRVVDNTIVDAGNNNDLSQPIYRHAIGFFGTAAEIDIARNMIYDTLRSAGITNGLYSLYLKQASAASTTTIRTSQNTVRVNSADPNVQLQSSFPAPNGGIVDATSANNVALVPITGQSPGSPAPLNVDFTSFTRYIVTIQGSFSPSTINVMSPAGDTTGVAQWTVGQLVTFRFRCIASGGCRFRFDPAYSITGDFADLVAGYGQAITFEVENFSSAPNTRRFFELYRTPAAILN